MNPYNSPYIILIKQQLVFMFFHCILSYIPLSGRLPNHKPKTAQTGTGGVIGLPFVVFYLLLLSPAFPSFDDVSRTLQSRSLLFSKDESMLLPFQHKSGDSSRRYLFLRKSSTIWSQNVKTLHVRVRLPQVSCNRKFCSERYMNVEAQERLQ